MLLRLPPYIEALIVLPKLPTAPFAGLSLVTPPDQKQKSYGSSPSQGGARNHSVPPAPSVSELLKRGTDQGNSGVKGQPTPPAVMITPTPVIRRSVPQGFAAPELLPVTTDANRNGTASNVFLPPKRDLNRLFYINSRSR